MSNLSQIILELKQLQQTKAGKQHVFLGEAIKNLEAALYQEQSSRGTWFAESEKSYCNECQPGRPCYGHGHY